MANINATQQMFGTSSSSDRSTPIEHLDYDYIGKCEDARELEKIYKVLRSGTEGYFPDLVGFCEKRLADLAPKSKLLRKEVKPATEYDLGKEEWTKLNNDVKEWADDITKQGSEDGEVTAEDKLPPVRNRGVINTAGKKNESSKEWGKPSAERIKGSDFRTWDKYDAEAEESKLDEQAKDESMKAAYEKLAKARSAAEAREIIDTSGMSDRERETVANREKDKGNEAFRASDYQEAILYYSRSLSVVASAPAYNNRSLARIKLGEFEGAVEDCTKVLHLEPTNIKALLRRGTARKSLKNYELALKDLQAVLQVEPNNKQALDMVNDVVTKMEKDKTQIEGKLKKNGSPSKGGQQLPNGETKPKSGGRRLVIQEVEEEEEEESGEEEYADASEKEVSVSKKISDRNGVENGTSSPARNGTSETDGCVSSKAKQQTSSNASASPPAGKDASQTTNAANQGSKEDQGGKEIPVPTPPKPAPPLPSAVVTLKDAGNDFFKKGQYTDANDSYSKAINKLEKDREVHPMGLSTLFSNRASCHLKSGSPKSCIEDCTSALDLNPNNVKTYLKRAQAYEMLEKYDYAYVDFKTAMNYDLYNANAQNGASRMLPILKDKHGRQWREKLPSQPKSPSIPWPAYVTSNLNSSTSADTSTTMTSDSRTQTGPVVTTAQVQTTKPAAKTSTAQTTPPVAEAPPPSSSANTATPSAQKGAPPTPEGGVASPTKTTPNSNSSPASSQPSPGAGKTRSALEKPKTLTKEERFQEFKGQGNDLVKKGAYSQAIGCYTRSIEVDPSQAVSYSNRALCYLKLELPEDAIVDCSEALKRDPKGIKALYRRAQARRMLGSFQDSIKDLMDLLKLEPKNAPAMKELEVVKDAWRKDLRDKQSKTAQESNQNQGKTAEENRGSKKKKSGKRMQIEEVTESSDEDKEATTTKSKAPSTSHPGSHAEGRAKPATSSPATEKGAVDTGRTENRKKDGAATGGKGEKVNRPSSSNVANGVPSPKKMTAYEFMQEWTSLKKKKTVEGHAKLLKQVQPNDIPKVLSNKLDGDMLGKILNASANHLVEDDPVFTYQLLNKLRCVDRFKTMAMFLSKMDKDNMQRCINMISSKPEVCKEEDLKKLKKAYQI